jgi:phage-related minor tail protein
LSKRVRGITVEIGGDTVGLQKALSDVNEKGRDLQKELRDVDRLLKFDPSNTELLAQRQAILGEAVENTSKKLEDLKAAEADVQAQFERGEISEQQYRNFKREIADTESYLRHLEGRLEKTTTNMQKFGEGMQKAGERMQNTGKKMGEVGKTLTKRVTAPIVAIGAAVGAAAIKAGAWADAMLDTAAKTGISTDTLQAYERIEARAGITTGTMAAQVEKLNKKFADGELDAKKVTIATEKMGMSFEDFVALPAEEKMDNLMSAMQGMEQQERIDLANLLGVTDLLPALEAADGEWNDFKEGMAEGAIPEESLETMAAFTNGLNELWQQAKHALIQALVPLIEKFEEFRPQLEEKLVPAIEKVVEFIHKLVEWFFSLDEGVLKTIGVIVGLLAIIGPLLALLAPVVVTLGAVAKVFGVAAVAIGALSAPVLIAIAVIAAIIAIGVLLWRNWDTIIEKAQELAANIKKWFTQFKDNVSGKMNETKEKISEIWNSVMEFFKNIDLKQIGADIIQGLIDGIWSMFGKVGEAAKSIADNVGGTIKKFLGVSSPSKVLEEIGEDTGEGLVLGMQNMLGQVAAASENMAAAAVPDIETNAGTSSNGSINGASKAMNVNIYSPKALDVREANKEFKRTLNRLSLNW